MSARSRELRFGGCAPSRAALPGELAPIMAALSTATIEWSGTTGFAA